MATTTSNPSRPTVKDLDTKAIQGIAKHLAGVSSLTLLGASFTPASLKAALAEAAHTQWRQDVVTQKATRLRTRAVRKALKSYLVGTFGPDAVGVLEDFGFSPPKTPGRKTVAAKATGIAKAKATRTARHTMGTVQRKAVKGAPAASASAPATPPPATPAKPAAT